MHITFEETGDVFCAGMQLIGNDVSHLVRKVIYYRVARRAGSTPARPTRPDKFGKTCQVFTVDKVPDFVDAPRK
jgi:hypothetical protein